MSADLESAACGMEERAMVSRRSSFLLWYSQRVSRLLYSFQRRLSRSFTRERKSTTRVSMVFIAARRFFEKPGSMVDTASREGRARPLMRLLLCVQSLPQRADSRFQRARRRLLRSVSWSLNEFSRLDILRRSC